MRVIRTSAPALRMERAILMICAAVFPSPRITSGTPCRIDRWWSTLAIPRLSNGRDRIFRKAASTDAFPSATCRSRSFSIFAVNPTPPRDRSPALPRLLPDTALPPAGP
ncbi:MAG TPA: hypothetical protein DEH27_02710 [Deltaproteobacteria bacterium]|nr:hypothetical protein [Deltaproteobacteria bacterium]